LLPSNESYTVDLIGKSQGEACIESVYKSEQGIITNIFQNVTFHYGSKIYISPLQSQTAYVDFDGDGSIDEEITAQTIPEFPSTMPLLMLMLTTLITTVLLKKKKKQNQAS